MENSNVIIVSKDSLLSFLNKQFIVCTTASYLKLYKSMRIKWKWNGTNVFLLHFFIISLFYIVWNVWWGDEDIGNEHQHTIHAFDCIQTETTLKQFSIKRQTKKCVFYCVMRTPWFLHSSVDGALSSFSCSIVVCVFLQLYDIFQWKY